MGLNHITINGRICNDIELKKTNSGVSVAAFTVAVDRNYSKEDKQTDFIPVVVFRQTAEFVSRYFSKGQPIIVEGRLQVRGYTDKEGNKRTATEVVANNVYFAGDKKQDKPQQKPTESFDDFDDFTEDGSDLPF